MTGKSQDIRITKTHMALSNTLIELLEKKSFKKITVNDICQSAMVSRSTFYMHFEDKYQLMLFCLQRERKQLDEISQGMELNDFLHFVLNSIYERKKVFYNFLHAEIDMELINMLKNFFHEYYSDILTLCEQQGVKLAGSIPIIAAYYENGFAGTIIWWIEQNYSVSVEEMVSCMCNLLPDISPKQS